MNLNHIYFLLIEKSWQTTNLQTGKMETTWDVFLTMIPLTCDMESHVISSLPSDLWQSSRPVWRTNKNMETTGSNKTPNFNKPRRVVGEKIQSSFCAGNFKLFSFSWEDSKLPKYFWNKTTAFKMLLSVYCGSIATSRCLGVQPMEKWKGDLG